MPNRLTSHNMVGRASEVGRELGMLAEEGKGSLSPEIELHGTMSE